MLAKWEGVSRREDMEVGLLARGKETGNQQMGRGPTATSSDYPSQAPAVVTLHCPKQCHLAGHEEFTQTETHSFLQIVIL